MAEFRVCENVADDMCFWRVVFRIVLGIRCVCVEVRIYLKAGLSMYSSDISISATGCESVPHQTPNVGVGLNSKILLLAGEGGGSFHDRQLRSCVRAARCKARDLEVTRGSKGPRTARKVIQTRQHESKEKSNPKPVFWKPIHNSLYTG